MRTLSLHAACTSRRLWEIVREPHPLVTAPHKPYPFQRSQIDAAASPLPPFLPKHAGRLLSTYHIASPLPAWPL